MTQNNDQSFQLLQRYTSKLQSQLANKTAQDPWQLVEELSTALEELKVAEEELRQQNEALAITQVQLVAERQRYVDLFEHAPDAYIITDSDTTIQQANSVAAELFGVSQQYLVGKPLLTFVELKDRLHFRHEVSQLQQMRQTQQVQSWQFLLQPRGKSALTATLDVMPVWNSDGQLKSLRWLIRDHTSHETLERELDTLRKSFLETVSQELRTPLTNIKMALHVLKVTQSQEQRERCINILETQLDREIDLVNKLLELQQLETGNYPTFFPEVIHLNDWLAVITAPFYPRTQQRQQQFLVQMPDSLPYMISDRASLRQLLVELLQNAHKFTPAEGQIVLDIHSQLEQQQIQFTVRNQAEIPASEIPYIFDKFYRISYLDIWKSGGTGLGLALVKALVAQLRGHIKVISEQGWTTFSITLPLKAIPERGSSLLPYPADDFDTLPELDSAASPTQDIPSTPTT